LFVEVFLVEDLREYIAD